MKAVGRLLAVVVAAFGFVAATAAMRPGESPPAPAVGCSSDREFTVPSAEGIVIAGTLSTPRREGPRPAVLMITGNGPHTRDQTISGSPMFAMLAEHLARRGMAVARTDARGYGASTGPDDWELYTTEDRVVDNRAVLAFLGRQEGIDPRRIVLLGHSEGATIAAALGASGARPALSVLLSPPALPGREIFARQRADNLRRRGASEEVAEAVYGQLLRFADFLAEDRDDPARFEAIALDFLAAHGVAEDRLDPAFARSLLEGFLEAPWYRSFAAHDPRPALERIDTPVLAVYGGADEQVPWRAHLPALVAALAGGSGADVATVVIPDQDHFFLEFEGRRLDEHRSGEMAIAGELLDLLDAELGRRGLVDRPCS